MLSSCLGFGDVSGGDQTTGTVMGVTWGAGYFMGSACRVIVGGPGMAPAELVCCCATTLGVSELVARIFPTNDEDEGEG